MPMAINGSIKGGSALSIGTGMQISAATAAADPFDENLMDSLINVDMFMTPISNVGFTAISTDSSTVYNAYRNGSTQNDEVNYDLALRSGTWTVELFHHTSTNAGIYTIQFDGVTKGTIDAYSGSFTYNVRSQVTGISVATTGKVRVKLLMATKNASSSGYTRWLMHLQLKRTA